MFGIPLFVGEWLLGSLGWGVFHGILACIAIAVAAGLLAVGVAGRRLAGAFLVGVGVAITVGVALASRMAEPGLRGALANPLASTSRASGRYRRAAVRCMTAH
jgi:hypothetical protein